MAHIEPSHPATAPRFDPEAAPECVRLAADGSRVTFEWHDGASASLTAFELRGACRCAWCTAARHRGSFSPPAPDITVTNFEAMGRFAAHIAFSDHHRKGIYPWTYLRALVRSTAHLSEPAA